MRLTGDNRYTDLHRVSREHVENEAWRIVHSPSAPLDARVEAALAVIHCLHQRSIFNYPHRGHPGLGKYAKHLLNGGSNHWCNEFGQDVVNVLVDRYSRPEGGARMKDGETQWVVARTDWH
jgi:hypothetical protein